MAEKIVDKIGMLGVTRERLKLVYFPFSTKRKDIRCIYPGFNKRTNNAAPGDECYISLGFSIELENVLILVFFDFWLGWYRQKLSSRQGWRSEKKRQRRGSGGKKRKRSGKGKRKRLRKKLFWRSKSFWEKRPLVLRTGPTPTATDKREISNARFKQSL